MLNTEKLNRNLLLAIIVNIPTIKVTISNVIKIIKKNKFIKLNKQHLFFYIFKIQVKSFAYRITVNIVSKNYTQ